MQVVAPPTPRVFGHRFPAPRPPGSSSSRQQQAAAAAGSRHHPQAAAIESSTRRKHRVRRHRLGKHRARKHKVKKHRVKKPKVNPYHTLEHCKVRKEVGRQSEYKIQGEYCEGFWFLAVLGFVYAVALSCEWSGS